MTKKNERIRAAWISCIILAIAILAILIGKGKIDSTKLFGICAFEQSHNIPCPFCGMTTAVCLFARGDIAGAFEAQPAAAIFSIIASLYLMYCIIKLLGIKIKSIDERINRIRLLHIITLIAAIILIGWAISIIRYKFF